MILKEFIGNILLILVLGNIALKYDLDCLGSKVRNWASFTNYKTILLYYIPWNTHIIVYYK